MRSGKWTCLVRVLIGGGAGLLACIILVPYITLDRNAPPVMCLLCAALGGAAGVATLPFADDGKTLLLRSAAHFAVTSVLFLLLAAYLYSWEDWEVLLVLEGSLALLYALIWLGRWVGWYMEVMQLCALLGLDAGPSPLKWRETLPYLPLILLLCDGLPILLRWVEQEISGGVIDIPVLSALFLPFVLLPVGGILYRSVPGKTTGGMSAVPNRLLCVLSAHAVSAAHRGAVPLFSGVCPRSGGQRAGLDVPPGGTQEEKTWNRIMIWRIMLAKPRLFR